jgi:hypothetical protein
MPLPHGSYVVFGQFLQDGDPPQVHLLDKQKTDYLRRQATLSRVALAAAFGMTRSDTVLPAWSAEAMSLIAQHYSGAHAVELRGLCAAIALGRPFGQDARRKSDESDGGERATPTPKPKAPKGGDKVSPFASLLTTGGNNNDNGNV